MQSEEAQAQAFVLVIPEPKIQKKKKIVHFLVSLSLIKTKVSKEKYKTLQLEDILSNLCWVRDQCGTFPNLPLDWPTSPIGVSFPAKGIGGK